MDSLALASSVAGEDSSLVGQIQSVLSKTEFKSIRYRIGRLPDGLTIRMARPEERPNRMPAGNVCIYTSSIDAGLTLPFHPFLEELFAYFELCPAMVAPSSWIQALLFISVCMKKSLPLSLSVFRSIFQVNHCREEFKDWVYFWSRKGKWGSCKWNASIKTWRKKFFVVKTELGIDYRWKEVITLRNRVPILTSEESEILKSIVRGMPYDMGEYLRKSDNDQIKSVSLSHFEARWRNAKGAMLQGISVFPGVGVEPPSGIHKAPEKLHSEDEIDPASILGKRRNMLISISDTQPGLRGNSSASTVSEMKGSSQQQESKKKQKGIMIDLDADTNQSSDIHIPKWNITDNSLQYKDIGEFMSEAFPRGDRKCSQSHQLELQARLLQWNWYQLGVNAFQLPEQIKKQTDAIANLKASSDAKDEEINRLRHDLEDRNLEIIDLRRELKKSQLQHQKEEAHDQVIEVAKLEAVRQYKRSQGTVKE